jgi:hypothetical protein
VTRPGAAFWLRGSARVLARPHLWATALRQARRLAQPSWWRRPPFLPLPDPDYLDFRFTTQYGDGGRPDPADLVTYLEWCRAMHPVETSVPRSYVPADAPRRSVAATGRVAGDASTVRVTRRWRRRRMR